ncbi:hypothetical protein LCGC14_1884350 [marine sediment metagenome]|uniref:Aspartate racemase n=1 Tax=marine sediment metagenome TaxID=412755 RepID=A0A0F9G1E1_9ZZZZ
MIGIVGGVGPYAGLDLLEKVFDQTRAATDQQHLDVALLSLPGAIADRTEFLSGRVADNPAEAIVRVILKLAAVGAEVIGIPCNTAHSPRIFDAIRGGLQEASSGVHLVHMIEEVGRFMAEHLGHVRTVGVLSTTGTYRAGVYPEVLAPLGLRVVVPDEDVQSRTVHRAIYDEGFGIKAHPRPVTGEAMGLLDEAIGRLRRDGAEAIVLGCTELPLAVREARIGDTVLVDANWVLARALIREAAPDKLKGLDF